MDQSQLESHLAAALSQTGNGPSKSLPISIGHSEGGIVLKGECDSLVQYRRILSAVASIVKDEKIDDRLRIRTEPAHGDGDIRDSLIRLLDQEPVLLKAGLKVRDRNEWIVVRQSPADPAEDAFASSGDVAIEVREACVTLSGKVISIPHRAFIGALCWWVPGVAKVVNHLEVTPAEAIDGGDLHDVIQMLLEKDPVITASQITVGVTDDGRVMLRGYVASQTESDRAEMICHSVEGIVEVQNQILVEPQSARDFAR